jgi:hypothetical protein
MIIQAADQFNLEDLHVSLLTTGCYVFHDAMLENICQDVVWQAESPRFSRGCDTRACDILQSRVAYHTQDFFPLELIDSFVASGIDYYTDQWHNDAGEKMDLQFLCYQTTLSTEEGGSLEMQCFDGITRQYFPRVGDVVVINHKDLLVHRVNPIRNGCARIVCGVVYRYAYD